MGKRRCPASSCNQLAVEASVLLTWNIWNPVKQSFTCSSRFGLTGLALSSTLWAVGELSWPFPVIMGVSHCLCSLRTRPITRPSETAVQEASMMF